MPVSKELACTCGRPANADMLLNCVTCKRSWHASCVEGAVDSDGREYSCPTCCEGASGSSAPPALDATTDQFAALNLNGANEQFNTYRRRSSNFSIADDEVPRNTGAKPRRLQTIDSAGTNASTTTPLAPPRLAVDVNDTRTGVLPAAYLQNMVNAAIRHNIQETRRITEQNMQQMRNMVAEAMTDVRAQMQQLQPRPVPQPNLDRVRANDANQLAPGIYLQREPDYHKLPQFDGQDPQSWVRFEVAYQHQRRRGITNDRLISNMTAALKGDAYEVVAAQLMWRADPELIMQQLRRWYGNADRVLDRLTQSIFDATAPRDQPKHQLRKFAILVQRLVTNIVQYEREEQLHSVYVERAIVKKLRDEHKDAWGAIKRQHPNHNLRHLAEFLIERAQDLSAEVPERHTASKRPPIKRIGFNDPNYDVYDDEVADADSDSETAMVAAVRAGYRRNLKCFECGDKHILIHCRIFLNQTIPERITTATKRKVCTSCLASTEHGSDDCEYKRACSFGDCQETHHWLLHTATKLCTVSKKMTSSESTQAETENTAHVAIHIRKRAHYGVVPLCVKNSQQQDILVYAMIDTGAGVTLISTELSQELGLVGDPMKLSLRWTDTNTSITESSHRTQLSVSVPGKNKVYQLPEVCTFSQLDLPVQSQTKKQFERYRHLQRISIPEYENVKPQILIGLPHASLCLGYKLRRGGVCEPAANKTSLGWLIYGVAEPSPATMIAQVAVQDDCHDDACTSCDRTLHELVKFNLSLESFGCTSHQLIPAVEEKRVQEIVDSTLKFNDRRYEVGLFWRKDGVKLPNSKPMALNRLYSTEKAVKAKGLLEWTNNRVKELMKSGYVRKATASDLSTNWERIWYLPMFVVVNQNKVPPKPRLVLDAAAATDGKSLNSFLLTGPDLLAPMLGMLVQMRERKYVVSGDARDMFHQFKLKPEDQQCQRFLWRDGHTQHQPSVYIFQVVAFGLKSSPATAQLIKNQHASKYRDVHPEAAEAAVMNTFVDDYLKSHNTEEETVRVTNDAIKIFEDMSLQLVNFQSNSTKVLTQLPYGNVKRELVELDTCHHLNYTTKILGMNWIPLEDVFVFLFNQSQFEADFHGITKVTTKRSLLSLVMKVFDPLGLIAPIVIQGRILLQKVWREGTNWDQLIPLALIQDFQTWLTILTKMSTLKIPRWYAPITPQDAIIQLHIFCDASQDAMAAAAYLRYEYAGGVEVALVMSKTKVMPLKTLSIPKAELSSALMAAKLAKTLDEFLTVTVTSTTFWTDSTCALSQINSDKKLQQFFATRVGDILETSTRQQWRYVPTKENPADYATKWRSDATDINSLWFQGPAFLRSPHSSWPQPPSSAVFALLQEVEANHSDSPFASLLRNIKEKFLQSWRSLRRVVALRMRFVKQHFLKVTHEIKYLTADELKDAEKIIVSVIQAESFPDDYSILRAERPLPPKSKLRQLSPFMAEMGTIRLRSRLQNASLSPEAKNPLILPTNHSIVESLIQHYHDGNHHLNEDTIIANLRKKYWILNVRKVVRRIKRACSFCEILRTTPTVPMMGDFPFCRVDFEAYPFQHCGVDCFGPVYVTVGRARVPRPGLIFVDMVTRAIHLEALEDMSTPACQSAIEIFANLYGPPEHFYSDNGTNFVGLANRFRNIAENLAPRLADRSGITWHFNPPRTPHFGGAWERMIQSVKKMMQVIENHSKIKTEFDLRNVFSHIAYRINDRPLTHIPVALDEDLPWTPNRFIRPRLKQSILASQLDGGKLARVTEEMMKKFAAAYLPVITRRSKWLKDTKPLQIDDVVLQVDFSKPKLEWKRGIVTKLFPGKDGRPRVAEIRTADGPKRTGVVNLARLDLKSASNLSSADGGEDVNDE